MRDLILYGDKTMSVRSISSLLEASWPVRYTAEHDQLDLIAKGRTDGEPSQDVTLLMYSISRENLPPTMLEEAERGIIATTVGEVWNPLMVQYSDAVIAKQVVSLVVGAFGVVIDTDHGDLIPGSEWTQTLAANPDWDLHEPLD